MILHRQGDIENKSGNNFRLLIEKINRCNIYCKVPRKHV